MAKKNASTDINATTTTDINATTEFEVVFGNGKIGLQLDPDILQRNVMVGSIAGHSLAHEHVQMKVGLMIIKVNGENVEGGGYDIALAKYKEASEHRTEETPMRITFRSGTQNDADDTIPIRTSRSSSMSSYAGEVVKNRERILKEKVQEVKRTQSDLEDAQQKIQSEIHSHAETKKNMKLLAEGLQSIMSGSIPQAPDATVKLALCLLAWGLILLANFSPVAKLLERALPEEYLLPLGLSMEIWISFFGATVLFCSHYFLAKCQAHDRYYWSSGYSFVFSLLLFLMSAGYGILFITTVLDESKRKTLSGLSPSSTVRFMVCAHPQDDNTLPIACRPDTETGEMVNFFRNEFSNYLFYGANLGLMMFSLKMECDHFDPLSRIVRKLDWDLKYVTCILHGMSLALVAIRQNMTPVTLFFCLYVLYCGKFQFKCKNQLVLSYFSRVVMTTCIALLFFYWYIGTCMVLY